MKPISKVSTFVSALMLLATTLLFAMSVSAQFESATVLGTVRDPNAQ